MPNNYGGEAPLSYSEYLRIPDLLRLQDSHSDPDKLLFITIHQTFELWFKQILHELDAAILDMAEDHAPLATRELMRIIEIEKLLLTQIHLLETMTPHSFREFRDELAPSSGFKSLQFREIEFSSGLKDIAILEQFRYDDFAYSRLKARYERPTLSESFYALLSRRGFDAPPDQLGLDPEERRTLYERRVRAALEVLSKFENPSEEFQLAETLIEHDEYFGLWRSHHNKMIERMGGPNHDPGGLEGIGYLGATLNKNFFPELWKARSTYLQTQQ
jgi:tryptophan 2,3-dioxygenase